jgi:hypothetical protein
VMDTALEAVAIVAFLAFAAVLVAFLFSRD